MRTGNAKLPRSATEYRTGRFYEDSTQNGLNAEPLLTCGLRTRRATDTGYEASRLGDGRQNRDAFLKTPHRMD